MTLQTLQILRMTLGLTAAVAVSCGTGLQLGFVSQIFTALFLALPMWIGWKKAIALLLLMAFALLLGLVISFELNFARSSGVNDCISFHDFNSAAS